MTALGPFFVSCSLRYLPSKLKYRPDVQEAWIRVFCVMTDLMKRGYPNFEVEMTIEERGMVKRTYRYRTR